MLAMASKAFPASIIEFFFRGWGFLTVVVLSDCLGTGMIFVGRWNPDGKGSRRMPAHLQETLHPVLLGRMLRTFWDSALVGPGFLLRHF